MLDTNDVFIIDSNTSVFVWIGNKSSKSEKSNAMKYADDYLSHSNKPKTTPITRIKEGQINFAFDSAFHGDDKLLPEKKKNESSSTKSSKSNQNRTSKKLLGGFSLFKKKKNKS